MSERCSKCPASYDDLAGLRQHELEEHGEGFVQLARERDELRNMLVAVHSFLSREHEGLLNDYGNGNLEDIVDERVKLDVEVLGRFLRDARERIPLIAQTKRNRYGL